MAKGMALTIGLNSVDPEHYGWLGSLNACESDATAYTDIAKSRNFNVKTLLTKDATRANVIDEVSQAANTLKAGDIFMLSYAGHGGQIPDLNGDELDELDETMCLYDGQLTDDELNALFAKFAEGVRILVFSDSCHSGTNVRAEPPVSCQSSTVIKDALQSNGKTSTQERYRSMPIDVCLHVYMANKTFYDNISQDKSLSDAEDNVKASVLLLSACQDDQLSRDGIFHGLFTSKLLYVWNHGGCDKNYRQFYDEIYKLMPSVQQPNYYRTGKIDSEFENEKVFEL